jgi:Mg2+ and Co2+ transporter CorA
MTATVSTEYTRHDAHLAELKINATFEQLALSSDPFARLIARQVERAVDLENELLDLGQSIIAKIEQVQTRLAAGPSQLNRLGELQRTPVDYDRACTQLSEAIQTMCATAAAYKMHVR